MPMGKSCARKRFAGAFVLSALALGTPAACNGNDTPEIALRPDGAAGTGATGGKDGGADVQVGDGAPADAGDAGLPDAAFTPVRVGIAPVPGSSNGKPTQGDALMAELEILGAGSRGIPVVRRWASLFVDATQPVAAEWDRLESSAAQIRAAGRSVLLCLALVDRSLDARPPAVGAAWDAPTTKNALEALIDRSLSTYKSELGYVALGTDVDRYFLNASASERAAFVSLLSHGLDYGRSHPGKSPGTRFGVTLSFQSITAGLPAELSALVAASDVAVVTYTPLDAAYQAKSPSTAAADLDLLHQALAADGGAKQPIVLQEVSYPSAAQAGSSPDKQKTFFDAFFQALLARRDRHPFVGVVGLHDATNDVCEAEAVAFGATGNAALIQARCSLGVRLLTGEAKPAEKSVFAALASFATP